VVSGYLEIYLKYFRPKLARGKETDRFFIPVKGGNICDESISRGIARFCREAGIDKKITSHCFRHSFCSHLLASGLGIREISELVGHKGLDITAGYARVRSDDLVDIVKKNHPRERAKDKILEGKNGIRD
jgi:integrase/recombinase XerD